MVGYPLESRIWSFCFCISQRSQPARTAVSYLWLISKLCGNTVCKSLGHDIRCGKTCSKDQIYKLWTVSLICRANSITSGLRQGLNRQVRARSHETSKMTLFKRKDFMPSIAQWKAQSSAISLDLTDEYDCLLCMITLLLQSLIT